MNRLTPLIVRRPPLAASQFELWEAQVVEQGPAILDDLRLFATGWLGGLVFFGTFLA